MTTVGATPNDHVTTIASLEPRLRTALVQGLPGVDAQLLFAPRPRPAWRPGYSPESARPAAALVLIYPVEDDVAVPLTLRASGLARHGGQVSLPGGAIDHGEGVEQAALREAAEEIGLTVGEVRVLGPLTPLHIPVSGFALHPVLAVADRRPRFQPASGEVDRILEVRLGHLTDPSRLGRGVLMRDAGERVEFAYFDLLGHEVWGATAMVLAEFLCLLGVRPQPWP